MLFQDTANVTSVKDLDNTFRMASALHLDTRRSNTTHKVYESVGSQISIGDYNDETKVQLCLAEGCDYIFTVVL